ncbi:MAG: type I-E CRISPR-associated protein Cse2/CasB [Rubrimonas sp.]
MPPDAPAPTFADAVRRLAREIALLEPGPLAELRRLDPEAPPAAFWRLVHRCDLAAAHRDLRGWERLARALAVLTPTGRDPSKRPAHDGAAPLGRVVADAGVSEQRVMRLLAAAPPQRREILARLCRRLARADMRLDAVQLGRLMIDDQAGETLRRLASDYYGAQAEAAPAKPAPTEKEPADV